MEIELTHFLRRMADQHASDLFFTVGAPPNIKVDGTISPKHSWDRRKCTSWRIR